MPSGRVRKRAAACSHGPRRQTRSLEDADCAAVTSPIPNTRLPTILSGRSEATPARIRSGVPATGSTTGAPLPCSGFAVAVAQLVEPRVVVPVVGGSSPLRHLFSRVARFAPGRRATRACPALRFPLAPPASRLRRLARPEDMAASSRARACRSRPATPSPPSEPRPRRPLRARARRFAFRSLRQQTGPAGSRAPKTWLPRAAPAHVGRGPRHRHRPQSGKGGAGRPGSSRTARAESTVRSHS